MKTILVVNGEAYWKDYLSEFKVVQKKIQTTEWLLKNGELYAVDVEGLIKPDGILWRLGAISPDTKHQEVLNLIALSNIPCVNSAEVLQMGYDRLSMLLVLQKSDFPVIPFDVVTNNYHLKNLEREFPFVVKVGNYHGGFGKVLVENERSWQDLKDLLFVSNTYITVEPYINYDLDIRYLAIGEKVWAMARKGKHWKANVETTSFTLIEKDKELTQKTLELQRKLQSDIIAVDILQEKNGDINVVEYNDIPGLSGFPNEVQIEVAERLKSKM
jgi:ribosomal protein S6--L-glutamate ligase